ncbi:OprO/OprP family phosphate-selective porin [Maioricimonas rarisocia]|nr:porin [Maioricimonas rarisocia]
MESGYPTVSVKGLFQVESAWFGQDAASTAAVGDIPDSTDFRRARLAATGHVAENVNYMIEFDFGFPGRPTFMDVYATVEDVSVLGNVRVGQWRQPFSMDALTSVKELMFLERSTAFTFFPFRQTGIGAFDTAFDEQATWAVSAFRYPVDQFGGSFGDSGYGLSTRLTGLLLEEGDDALVHAGFNFAHLQPSTHRFRFRSTPEIGFTAGDINGGPTVIPFFVDTGNIPAQSAQMLGTELAGQVGGVTLQSELMYAMVNQEGGPSLAFPAIYAQASYALTGERRSYNRKQGVFGRIVPHHNFGTGYSGAWEVAARWSWINLNDANIQGGELTDLTLGLNWYLNRYFKAQFNYIHAILSSPGAGDSGTDILAVRAQIDF